MTDSLFPSYQKARLVRLEAKAIARLREYVPVDGQPYWVGFSGGKDSVVLKAIVEKSTMAAEYHYSVTTLDPPELVRFIRKEHRDVAWDRPKKSFFHLMVERGLPMRPHGRWCCDEFKESGPTSKNRVVVLGIRWAESPRRRRDRQVIQQCYKDRTKHYLHPILEWTDNDVWDYIRTRNLPYCELYDQGFKRLGCIGCPFASQKNRDREFARYPRMAALYKKYINRFYEKAVTENKEWAKLHSSGDDLYLAWRGLIPWPKAESDNQFSSEEWDIA